MTPIQTFPFHCLQIHIFKIVERQHFSNYEIRLYTTPTHTIWKWGVDVNKVALVFRITRPLNDTFMNHNLKFKMLGHEALTNFTAKSLTILQL